jgi:hypothetical protein
MLKGYNYVSEKGEENVKRYQYRGGDGSILYKYFFGPLAELCLKYFVPPTIA